MYFNVDDHEDALEWVFLQREYLLFRFLAEKLQLDCLRPDCLDNAAVSTPCGHRVFHLIEHQQTIAFNSLQ